MIERLKVQNYKSLRNVDVRLTRMHLLIGPNDSGKTSLLEALAALSRSVDNSLPSSFEGSWSGRELVWQSKDLPVSFEVNFKGVPSYALQVNFAREGRDVRIAMEHLDGQDFSHFRNNQQTSIWFAIHQSQSVDGAFVDRAKQVHAALSGVHTYRWIPRLLGLPCAVDPQRRFRMLTEGFGLALVLDEILGYDRDRFVRLETRFREIFPQVKSIKLQQSPAFIAHGNPASDFPMLQQSSGKGLYFEMASGGNLIPASEISDGILLVLAYLTVLHLPQPPRLLLVEEPENGIHPARLRDVLQILRQLVHEQQQTQIVMTTHSPYVVDLFKPEEVSLCHKDGSTGEATIRNLSESAMVRDQIKIFTLGEIWTGEGDETIAKDTVGSK
ncbi:MAG: AAA family ATPase [Phycisphaerae bacterium]